MAIEKILKAEFDGMTWGDLRYLLQQAEDAGITDDESVDFMWTDDSSECFGIELELKAKKK
ncbi:hypothetical protein [Georgenia wangjunii]|uniref:hypothetical protein n=1 Tax=Georgenia wangjunii TaxID=3117730 RepID=UPI002F266209